MNIFNLSFGKDSMATEKQTSIDEYLEEWGRIKNC